MRQVQRGISVIFLVISILVLAVAVTSGYFAFSKNLSEKMSRLSPAENKAIDSFEECAKHYPVMESYPEQCNTPDGKHFVRELTEDEKQRLQAPSAAPQDPDGSVGLKEYTNSDYGISFLYPSDALLKEENNGNIQFIVRINSGQEEVTVDIVGEEMGSHPFGMNPASKKNINGIEWEYFPSTNYCDAGECGDTSPIYQTFNGHYRIHLITENPEPAFFKEIVSSFELQPDGFYRLN